MKDEFGEGMIFGGCIGAFVTFLLCGAAALSSISSVNSKWERDCVVHGAAENATTDDGGTEWRWKDGR